MKERSWEGGSIVMILLGIMILIFAMYFGIKEMIEPSLAIILVIISILLLIPGIAIYVWDYKNRHQK